MPGYGYSDRPADPPLDAIAVAGLWVELMGVLGYARFGAAGGDIGSQVSRYLGLDHPGRVVAVHRTDAGLPVYAGDPADLAAEERAFLAGAAAWAAAEGAYGAMHRSVASAAGSHPERQLFGQATPGPAPTLRSRLHQQKRGHVTVPGEKPHEPLDTKSARIQHPGGGREVAVDIVHPRVAGIDVHKKVAWVAVRLPGEAPGER